MCKLQWLNQQKQNLHDVNDNGPNLKGVICDFCLFFVCFYVFFFLGGFLICIIVNIFFSINI